MSEAAELQERIKRMERRIHNQRRSLRDNWEIVEMRRKWLGSDTARRMYCFLFKRHKTLLAENERLKAALQAIAVAETVTDEAEILQNIARAALERKP